MSNYNKNIKIFKKKLTNNFLKILKLFYKNYQIIQKQQLRNHYTKIIILYYGYYNKIFV